MRFPLLALLAVSALAAESALAVVTVQADDNVGASFQGDVSAANNPAVSSQPKLMAAVAAGDDLLKGNRVLVGYFTISDLEIQAHATDLGYLLDPYRFVRYGSEAGQAQIGDTYGIDGHFSHAVTGDADGQGLVGQQIYVFVLGSTDTSSFGRSVTTAFQIGIFYYDVTASPATAISPKWLFPSENAVPNNTVIDFSDLTIDQAGTAQAPAARIVLGGFGPDHSNAFPGATNFRLVAIPEPSHAALALLGGSLLLVRRPRKVARGGGFAQGGAPSHEKNSVPLRCVCFGAGSAR